MEEGLLAPLVFWLGVLSTRERKDNRRGRLGDLRGLKRQGREGRGGQGSLGNPGLVLGHQGAGRDKVLSRATVKTEAFGPPFSLHLGPSSIKLHGVSLEGSRRGSGGHGGPGKGLGGSGGQRLEGSGGQRLRGSGLGGQRKERRRSLFQRSGKELVVQLNAGFGKLGEGILGDGLSNKGILDMVLETSSEEGDQEGRLSPSKDGSQGGKPAVVAGAGGVLLESKNLPLSSGIGVRVIKRCPESRKKFLIGGERQGAQRRDVGLNPGVGTASEVRGSIDQSGLIRGKGSRV